MSSLHALGLPGQAPAGASFAQPFEMLAACHERVARSLALLQRLVDHLQGPALNPRTQATQAAGAATDVLRYFDLAAPQHHLDEERHVLPRLRTSGQAELLAAAAQIEADHREIERLWAALAPMLQKVAAVMTIDASTLAELTEQAAAFIALHARHMPLEDGLAFPAARQRTSTDEAQRMGEDMARRRQAPQTPPNPRLRAGR